MLIIPAIDLKDGKVVRYTKGRYNKKVYSADPVSVALKWQEEGARFLHVVDLDGALYHKPKNTAIIKRIIEAVAIPVEVGGGLRDYATIKRFIDIGAERVVLGTKAIQDPEFLKAVIAEFGKKIAVGLDTRGSKVGLYGWKEFSKVGIESLLNNFKELGLKVLILTDIQRDGTLKGVDIPKIRKIMKLSGTAVIVSGGVSSLSDIIKLQKLNSGKLEGLIIGKALYERRFTLEEALHAAKKTRA